MGEGAVAGGGVVLVLIGVLVWIVKRAFTSIVSQNRELVKGALENMKANTTAIEANTEATRTLSSAFSTHIAVRAEKDHAQKEQLDRIERLAGKAALGGR